jgi:hypothetical protein
VEIINGCGASALSAQAENVENESFGLNNNDIRKMPLTQTPCFCKTKRAMHLHKPPTLSSYVNYPFRVYMWIHQRSRRRLVNDILDVQMLVESSNLVPDIQQIEPWHCQQEHAKRSSGLI